MTWMISLWIPAFCLPRGRESKAWAASLHLDVRLSDDLLPYVVFDLERGSAVVEAGSLRLDAEFCDRGLEVGVGQHLAVDRRIELGEHVLQQAGRCEDAE